MPYTEPTSPVPIALRGSFSSSRRPLSNSNNNPPADLDIVSSSGPMPNIPRRSSSGNTTPRNATSPSFLRVREQPQQPSSSLTPQSPPDVGSLGLKLNGLSPRSRPTRDSVSSESSVAPQTPDFLPPLLPAVEKESPSEESLPTLLPNSQPAESSPAPRQSLLQRHNATCHYRRESSSSIYPSSSTDLPANNDSRPTFIRNKSGDIVKPSLKRRPMSTPDLSRRQSDPSSPESASPTLLPEQAPKSVRFNDRGLESVVLFLRGQKVTAVSKAMDSNVEGPATETEDDDPDLNDLLHFRTRRDQASRTTSEDPKDIELSNASCVPRVRVDFGPDARGALDGENVVLERVDIQNGTPLLLRGTVLVRNIAFQKWVGIRFTLDQWQTVSEVSGQHVSHIPAGTTGDEGWDRFSFVIKLEDYRRKIDERSLQLCVHFSVDGQEWWDSNRGPNYRFSFKRIPRRARSGITPFGGGFMRLNDSSSGLPALRPSRSTLTDRQKSHWSFPRPERSESPVTRIPAVAYQAPEPPNVHNHLQLKTWCAPSPPQSPRQISSEGNSNVPILPLAPVRDMVPQTMTIVGGHFATVRSAHERSRSWSGETVPGWESPPPTASDSDEVPAGDTTPVGVRSQSPETTSMANHTISKSTSDVEVKPISLKRSTGDLLSLVDGTDDLGLMTPPSSNLSSPPSPSIHLPGPMSPSVSTSTGESSPITTLDSDSTADNSTHFENDRRTLNEQTYKEFIAKFCFFKSPPPVTSHLDEPNFARPNYIPISGYSSPTNGYSYYNSHGSNSPMITPTQTSTEHQFSYMSPRTAVVGAGAGGSALDTTPRHTPPSVSGMIPRHKPSKASDTTPRRTPPVNVSPSSTPTLLHDATHGIISSQFATA